MLVALGLTALGAALVLVSSGRSRWADADGVAAISDSIPAAKALALLAFAGIGFSLLLVGWARSIFGVVQMLIGAGVLLVNDSARGYTVPVDTPDALHRSGSFWLTVVGGVVLGLGGLLTAVYGRWWPGTRRDYGAPGEPRPASRDDTWTALDRGEDPTI
jgi:hypothetical protein